MPKISRKSGEEYVDPTVRTTAFVAADEHVYRLDASLGSFNVYLPLASGIAGNDIVLYCEYDHANNVTVVPSGTETIAGSASLTLSQREAIMLTSNGVNDWIKLG
jgi:hypothetical protein